jgi:hypothetical protein
MKNLRIGKHTNSILAYPATILQRYDTQTPEKTMQTAQAVCQPGIQQQYP